MEREWEKGRGHRRRSTPFKGRQGEDYGGVVRPVEGATWRKKGRGGGVRASGGYGLKEGGGRQLLARVVISSAAEESGRLTGGPANCNNFFSKFSKWVRI
jgi:hypothetical protein